MKKLIEEDFNRELVALKTNFEKAGINPTDEFFNSVMNAPAALSEDTGMAYPGALAVHINLVTAIATRIAKMVAGTFVINEKSLYKVCVCQHLSKLQMYVPNDNQWEIDKRGLNYKFASLSGRLKFGERSIMNCISLFNVTFEPDEWEAMECFDKEGEEKTSKYFDCILSTIVRQANELATSIEKERYNKEK